MTPCMPCSFGPPQPQVRGVRPAQRPLGVTVTVRWIPLVTAAYGTWVARPVRTTMLAPGGDGSQLGGRVRPALGDHRLVGKSPEGSRQPVSALGYTSVERCSGELPAGRLKSPDAVDAVGWPPSASKPRGSAGGPEKPGGSGDAGGLLRPPWTRQAKAWPMIRVIAVRRHCNRSFWSQSPWSCSPLSACSAGGPRSPQAAGGIWGNPYARCIAADCRDLTAVLDAR